MGEDNLDASIYAYGWNGWQRISDLESITLDPHIQGITMGDDLAEGIARDIREHEITIPTTQFFDGQQFGTQAFAGYSITAERDNLIEEMNRQVEEILRRDGLDHGSATDTEDLSWSQLALTWRDRFSRPAEPIRVWVPVSEELDSYSPELDEFYSKFHVVEGNNESVPTI